MQVKLKLSKAEYNALLTMVRWAIESRGEPKDMLDFLKWDALRDLSMEMLRRVPELKATNSVTMKDGAMMALVMDLDPWMLPPYESAVYRKVMEGADKQWQKRLSTLKSNMLMIGGGS